MPGRCGKAANSWRPLRRREGAAGPGCPVTSIYSVHDNLVSPQATSVPWARNVALRGVGHVDILLDRRLHALVADEVRAAGVAFVPRAQEQREDLFGVVRHVRPVDDVRDPSFLVDHEGHAVGHADECLGRRQEAAPPIVP